MIDNKFYNISAEQAILGSIIMNNYYLNSVIAFLEPKHFYFKAHQSIYERILQLVDRNSEKADTITLKQFFEADEDVKEAGGSQYLSSLLCQASGVVDIKTYARIVIDLWQRRELADEIENIKTKLANPLNSFDDLRNELDNKIEGLVTDIDASEPKHIGILADEKLTEALAGENKDLIFTGFRDIDKYLGGAELTDLVVIGARPGMGKTILALNIAENIAKTKSVLFVSIEMSGKQLAARFMVKAASINPSRLRYGKLNQAEMQALQDNAHKMQESKLYIDDVPKGISIKQLKPKLKRIINKHDIKVLFVDYLQLMKPDSNRKNGNRTEDVGAIAEGLKAIAKEFKITVIALAQLSRAVETRDNKRPQLSDLRESGSIESAANSIMFIYRAEYYLNRMKPDEGNDHQEFLQWQKKFDEVKGKAEILIAKNRDGVSDISIECGFDGEFSKFFDK